MEYTFSLIAITRHHMECIPHSTLPIPKDITHYHSSELPSFIPSAHLTYLSPSVPNLETRSCHDLADDIDGFFTDFSTLFHTMRTLTVPRILQLLQVKSFLCACYLYPPLFRFFSAHNLGRIPLCYRYPVSILTIRIK